MVKPVFLSITQGEPKKLRKDFIIREVDTSFNRPKFGVKLGLFRLRQRLRRDKFRLRQRLRRDKLGLYRVCFGFDWVRIGFVLGSYWVRFGFVFPN
jgi:hypothetical protein